MGHFEGSGLFSVGKPRGYKWDDGMDRGKIILSEESLSFFPKKNRGNIFQYQNNKFELFLNEITEIETKTRRMFKYIQIHTKSGINYSIWPLNWTGNPGIKQRKELEELLDHNIKAFRISLIKGSEENKKEILNKMSRFIRVSEKLDLHMMRDILHMEQSYFNSKIIDWSVKFDFSIDGNNLIINNKEKIPDFIEDLKKEF